MWEKHIETIIGILILLLLTGNGLVAIILGYFTDLSNLFAIGGIFIVLTIILSIGIFKLLKSEIQSIR